LPNEPWSRSVGCCKYVPNPFQFQHFPNRTEFQLQKIRKQPATAHTEAVSEDTEFKPIGGVWAKGEPTQIQAFILVEEFRFGLEGQMTAGKKASVFAEETLQAKAQVCPHDPVFIEQQRQDTGQLGSQLIGDEEA